MPPPSTRSNSVTPEATRTSPSDLIGDLKQQGALADSRITTDQNESAGNNAAAKHSIKLGHARSNANFTLRSDRRPEATRCSCRFPDHHRSKRECREQCRRQALDQTRSRPKQRELHPAI